MIERFEDLSPQERAEVEAELNALYDQIEASWLGQEGELDPAPHPGLTRHARVEELLLVHTRAGIQTFGDERDFGVWAEVEHTLIPGPGVYLSTPGEAALRIDYLRLTERQG